MSIDDQVLLKLISISKSFCGTKVLQNVNFNVYHGRVMGLLGANGAGKSTLMKIMTGVHKKDSGHIYFQGKEVQHADIRLFHKLGISMVHQEPHIFPDLTIMENILLGREVVNRYSMINWKSMAKKASSILRDLGIKKRANDLSNNLSIGDQKLLEIAKALSFDAKIIIMDEPTDALTDSEVKRLFNIINMLCKNGRSVVYISHRMEEIFSVCNDITIIRDGRFVIESRLTELSHQEIIEKMVGRKIELRYFSGEGIYLNAKETLRVKNIKNGYINNINFDLQSGEILGIFGLVGSGRTELAKSIYGCYPINGGQIFIDNRLVHIKDPADALSNGIVYVSENRKVDGLMLASSVKFNMTLAALKRLSNNFFDFIDRKKELLEVNQYINRFDISPSDSNSLVKNLSGGNQQKVSIARALLCNPKILILDEPTRGVDIGAKREIYRLIHQLKLKGMSIILITSELAEIMAMSDRVLVLKDKEITANIPIKLATKEKIMSFAINKKMVIKDE